MSDIVERIPWFMPEVGEEELKGLEHVLRINYFNDGPVARQLEETLADLLGVNHCVTVTSGTTAITLALMAAGIGQGDEVIVPDLTFIATANAVTLTGATPVLVDVEPERFAIHPQAVEQAISNRTRAIVPVDVNGRGCDYQALTALSEEHGITLISDSAEALGSRYQGRYLGTYGTAGCFSFSANKTVSSGQGGLIATNDPDLYHRIKELKDQGRRHTGTGGDDPHPVLGFNFKYTNLQAAVALAQLQRLESRLQGFMKRDQWYIQALSDVPGITLPSFDEPGEVRQWMDIRVPAHHRDTIIDRMEARGFGCRGFWRPLHRQKPYARPDSAYTNTIQVAAEGFWLPSSFSLTEQQAASASAALTAIMADL
ncbi:MAG: DegT/DnrJ/EryC1/StrS family aminotransferase [Magnetococcales bacterium]|nr:DegT/DnrJ/EryC1/StrS family aminotransferase [Magnetococcales bacterium]